MNRRVRLSREARMQLDAADEWWRQNRPEAPNAFWDEFIAAMGRLIEWPESGTPVLAATLPRLMRALLPTSEKHVYYEATPRLIKVWTIWGARQGTRPPILAQPPRRRPPTARRAKKKSSRRR
jgi:hypothetical protein